MKQLPDHPFYTGFSVSGSIGDDRFQLKHGSVAVLDCSVVDDEWQARLAGKAKMVAHTEGGLVDEAILMAAHLNADGETVTRLVEAQKLMPSSAEGQALNVLKHVRELSPGILSDLKRALHGWHLYDKAWKEEV